MMDYHSIHGHDISSFDTSNTHRLPTVSASQVLDDVLKDDSTPYISTGLPSLDRSLLGSEAIASQRTKGHGGGIKRGQVTEIWGPPGSGKTALGIQLCLTAMGDGDGVVWIDCFHSLFAERLSAVRQALETAKVSTKEDGPAKQQAHTLRHYSCLTLAHLMALISRPTPTSIANDVSLIVVDSLSALVNAAVPRSSDSIWEKSKKGPTASAKRQQVLQYIINALQKLAATRNCGLVVLSQCATRMHGESGAALTSALSATVWEQGISTRIALFRNWAWEASKPRSVFLAAIQKQDGKSVNDGAEHVSAFSIDTAGLAEAPYDVTNPAMQISHSIRAKRKLGQTELEVPDSDDDEDYGWAEEDEAAMPAPPPQWQGSEDVILGQEIGQSDDEGDADSEQNYQGNTEASESEPGDKNEAFEGAEDEDPDK